MKTNKFARKPFYVDAVRVSEANMEEVAEWCKGTVETDADGVKFIRVEVHRPLTEGQTQAYVGRWVLFAGAGFKVYTPKAFDKSFEKVKGQLTKEQADAAGIKVPHEPRPKNDPKKAVPPKKAPHTAMAEAMERAKSRLVVATAVERSAEAAAAGAFVSEKLEVKGKNNVVVPTTTIEDQKAYFGPDEKTPLDEVDPPKTAKERAADELIAEVLSGQD